MSENVNVSARIPPYYLWVVDRLVGRRFKNRSDAVTQMMAAWLAGERDWLEKHDLGIGDYERPRPVEDPHRSTGPALIQPYASKGEGQSRDEGGPAPIKEGRRPKSPSK